MEILDREVAHAAARLDDARAALARGELSATDNPLSRARRVSTRATYVELGDAPAAPLRDALREWIAALTFERALWIDTARIEATLRDEQIQIEQPGIELVRASPRALVLQILRDPARGRRQIWADALARGAVPAADAARIYAERRAEAARLVGVDLDALEVPCDPKGALAEIAERFLRITAPLARRGARWHEALAEDVGRAFGEGWPAHLTPRWIADLFRGTGLTDGLRLHLDALPEPLGAASFARALAAFGAAYARASAPASAPFALARSPFDLRVARRAALFASVIAEPAFGVRALGLGRARARDQARGIAAALLRGLRLHAARVLLRGALDRPARERAARFEERTAEALGDPIPPALAGVLPRLRPHDAVSFAGALLAARDLRDIIERSDEDWFRNPHAAHALREEDSVLPASRRASKEDLEAGLAVLERALAALD